VVDAIVTRRDSSGGFGLHCNIAPSSIPFGADAYLHDVLWEDEIEAPVEHPFGLGGLWLNSDLTRNVRYVNDKAILESYKEGRSGTAVRIVLSWALGLLYRELALHIG
jgi:hypothetical protein